MGSQPESHQPRTARLHPVVHAGRVQRRTHIFELKNSASGCLGQWTLAEPLDFF